MVTRMGLVAKNKRFSLKNGDENKSRGQKQAFFNQKWRRKRGSSPKTSVSHRKMVTKTDLIAKMVISHRKMVTRTGLVVKKRLFSTKSGDENGSHRQNRSFLASKW
ncbi:hypothetical protein NSQ14_02600 [Caldifermentibacillus hisashii]|uniref:hypothetical protein n=1 Tax=Caldifermentibacillus hisashii TaxID=996558 RepID=UPI0031FD9D52